MNILLQQEFENALNQCRDLHASHISRDYINLFTRVAKAAPDEADKVIDILLHTIEVQRSNVIAALYCLMCLADVSDGMKKKVTQKFPNDQVEYYIEDNDKDISGNARILKAILAGASLNDFQKKSGHSSTDQKGMTIINSNISINSPYSSQSLDIGSYKITNLESYDEETQILLKELKEALGKRDKTATVKILSFLADKGFDLLIAIIAGAIYQK